MSLPYDPRPKPVPSEIAPSPTVSAPAPAPFLPARNAGAPRVAVHTDGDAVARYGDRAGEWMRMERGRFGAWMYVGLAFALQALLIGVILGGAASAVAGLFTSVGSSVRGLPVPLMAAGTLIGAVCAWFTFRDRWRVNEAFSSRFCSGLANLSVLYVPLVALVYANVRGIQKLKGR